MKKHLSLVRQKEAEDYIFVLTIPKIALQSICLSKQVKNDINLFSKLPEVSARLLALYYLIEAVEKAAVKSRNKGEEMPWIVEVSSESPRQPIFAKDFEELEKGGEGIDANTDEEKEIVEERRNKDKSGEWGSNGSSSRKGPDEVGDDKALSVDTGSGEESD
jgi:hypothetical protein